MTRQSQISTVGDTLHSHHSPPMCFSSRQSTEASSNSHSRSASLSSLTRPQLQLETYVNRHSSLFRTQPPITDAEVLEGIRQQHLDLETYLHETETKLDRFGPSQQAIVVRTFVKGIRDDWERGIIEQILNKHGWAWDELVKVVNQIVERAGRRAGGGWTGTVSRPGESQATEMSEGEDGEAHGHEGDVDAKEGHNNLGDSVDLRNMTALEAWRRQKQKEPEKQKRATRGAKKRQRTEDEDYENDESEDEETEFQERSNQVVLTQKAKASRQKPQTPLKTYARRNTAAKKIRPTHSQPKSQKKQVKKPRPGAPSATMSQGQSSAASASTGRRRRPTGLRSMAIIEAKKRKL